jgi:hypothetical protein
MILWNHWATGPNDITSYGILNSSDLMYWSLAFSGLNLFLFLYAYTGHLKNEGVEFGWNIRCAIHSISCNVKFSIISLFLLPKIQYFSMFCFDSEIDKLWIIYSYYSELFDVQNFIKNIKPSLCDSIIKTTQTISKSPTYEKSKSIINEDLFKIEKYINMNSIQCTKTHWVFGLVLMLIYFFFINNVLDYYPLKNMSNKSIYRSNQYKSNKNAVLDSSNTAFIREDGPTFD